MCGGLSIRPASTSGGSPEDRRTAALPGRLPPSTPSHSPGPTTPHRHVRSSRTHPEKRGPPRCARSASIAPASTASLRQYLAPTPVDPCAPTGEGALVRVITAPHAFNEEDLYVDLAGILGRQLFLK